MDAAQQEFFQQMVFYTSMFMLIDNLFSITYFHYTYMLELKRRFAIVGKGVPVELRKFLQEQIKHENGALRNFIQSAYIPWFIVCILANLWYLPLIVTVFTVISNAIFKKPYISPFMLMLNLVVFNCCYLYGVVYLFLMK